MPKKIAHFVLIYALFFGGLLSGCSSVKKPQSLISHKKYVNLIVEFELLKVYQRTYQDSVASNKLRHKIFKHYGITLKQFEQSRSYYIATHKEQGFLKEALDSLNVAHDKIWNIKHNVPVKKKPLPKKH